MRDVELVTLEDHQTMALKEQHKKRRPKKLYVLIGSLLFLFLASSTSAVAGALAYHTYNTDIALASMEMQHLRSAVTLLESLQKQPLAQHAVEQAQQEFAGALSDAQTIEASLTKFTGVAGVVPIYGSHLVFAMHLSALTVDVSQAGISGCKILEKLLSRMGSPLSATTSGMTIADFSTLLHEYETMKTWVYSSMNEAMFLQPGEVSFDAHLAKLLREFQADIPAIRAALMQADQLIPALPTLLGIGTPVHYLLEIMDTTELRPGGGFIGNYGIATLSAGHLTAAHISDTYLLDRPFELEGHSIPFPSMYQWFASYLSLSSWSLRNSNLDADFATDARNGELNYQREGGKVPLQGVMAITPYFIERVLNITGPISVPEYHETVTAQNIVNLIHFHQLGEQGSDLILSQNGYSSQRKQFTELLGEHLLARVQHFSSSDIAKFLQLAFSSLSTKDIQIYLNSTGAENALQFLHLDGSIQSPLGDHLLIVDANVANSKANSFIVNTMHDQVTLDQHGNVVHRTTITYAWTLTGQFYGNQVYQDYVRIYVPPESRLSTQNGWQPLGTSTAFGSQVWAGHFTLVHGQTLTITLLWSNHSVIRNGANGWHYQYLLQRQAGAQRMMQLQMMLPSCATMTNKWGGLVPDGKQEESLTQSLTQDVHTGVDFTCT